MMYFPMRLLIGYGLTLLICAHHAHAQQTAPANRNPIATLEKLAEAPTITKVLQYLNSDIPSVEDIQKAFAHFNIPETLHDVILLGIIKRILNPSQATTINTSVAPLANAVAKAQLIMEQLLPWYIQQTRSPQEAMDNALLVMVSFADYAPYWTAAASDFITFIENQRTFIKNVESYLNELIFIIVLRNNVWNKANKIDFMIKMKRYVEREANARWPRQQKRYEAALRKAQQKAAEQDAAESSSNTSSSHKRTAQDIGLVSEPEKFGAHITSLLVDLIDGAQTTVSNDTKLNATTQLIYEDESFSYPIFFIVISGNMKALSIALQEGADINVLNSTGINPLTFAVEEQYSDMVPELLKNGASIAKVVVLNGTPQYIYNALEDAVENNQLHMIMLLFAYGAHRISNEMLAHAMVQAQALHHNAVLTVLRRELKKRAYKKIISAVAQNDINTIKTVVRQVPQHIDKSLLRQALTTAEQAGTLDAYEVLSTYKALIDAVAASQINLAQQLLAAKAAYIDGEMLHHLLQMANANGYPPLINLVMREINARQQPAVDQEGTQP